MQKLAMEHAKKTLARTVHMRPIDQLTDPLNVTTAANTGCQALYTEDTAEEAPRIHKINYIDAVEANFYT